MTSHERPSQPKVKKSESDVESSEEDVKPKKKVKRETTASAKAEPEPESETEPEPARRAVAPRPAGGEVGDDLIDEDGRPYFLVSIFDVICKEGARSAEFTMFDVVGIG